MPPVSAKSLVGKWSGTIDTQIGKQQYVYTIESKDDALQGTAKMELDGNAFTSQLVNFKHDAAQSRSMRS